jgi:hypothetical protein
MFSAGKPGITELVILGLAAGIVIAAWRMNK